MDLVQFLIEHRDNATAPTMLHNGLPTTMNKIPYYIVLAGGYSEHILSKENAHRMYFMLYWSDTQYRSVVQLLSFHAAIVIDMKSQFTLKIVC